MQYAYGMIHAELTARLGSTQVLRQTKVPRVARSVEKGDRGFKIDGGLESGNGRFGLSALLCGSRTQRMVAFFDTATF